MKKILFCILASFILFACNQTNKNEIIEVEKTLKMSDLFLSKEMIAAYSNQSRDTSGKPGKNYYTNTYDVKIDAELDVKTRKITGKETIKYFNNSPDTLDRIILKIDADIFKKGNIRDYQVPQNDIHSGVNLSKIFVEGTDITKNTERIKNENSLLTILFPEKIHPKSTAELEINWDFVLNVSTFRMGTYDSDNFFVAYWYPQPAVYDDVIGWCDIPYTGMAEFYNDYGNYDVSITVPAGYNVWSTGLLQNPDKIYKPEIIEKYQKSLKTDSVIHVITKEDIEKNPFSFKTQKIHTYLKRKICPDLLSE